MAVAVFFAFAALLMLWSALLAKQQINKGLGSEQFMLFETYQQGEQTQFFIDQSARYAAYQAIHELANNGGYEQNSDCGKYNEYVLWNYMDKECFPTADGVNNNFTSVFDQRFGEYLDTLLSEDEEAIPIEYELVLVQDENLTIRGFPSRTINLIKLINDEDLQMVVGDVIGYDSEGRSGKTPGHASPLPEGELVLPLANNYITSCFEIRNVGSPQHHGIDLRASIGTDVFAFADGTVIFSDWSGGYGNLIIIEHDLPEYDFKFWSVYGHLSERHKLKGHVVSKGDVIGKSGETGGPSTGPHLHFEIRVGQNAYDNAVNPVAFEPNLFGKLESYNNNKACPATPCDWQDGAVCNQYLE